MTLAIKRIHNFPPHISYVSILPDITQKNIIIKLLLKQYYNCEKKSDCYNLLVNGHKN